MKNLSDSKRKCARNTIIWCPRSRKPIPNGIVLISEQFCVKTMPPTPSKTRKIPSASKTNFLNFPAEKPDYCTNLYAGLLQVSQIARRLARLLIGCHRRGVDGPERIDDHFSLHRLDWVHDDCDRTIGERFERLLGVDIDSRQPATESRMGMVPSDDHFGATRLLEHVEHLRLEDWIHGFDGDSLKTKTIVKIAEKLENFAENSKNSPFRTVALRTRR